MDVTVGVNEDIGRIREMLLACLVERPGFVTEPMPSLVVTALNDYNIALQLRAWISDERAHIRDRFRLRETVFETLRSANVDMPYETIQIQSAAPTADLAA